MGRIVTTTAANSAYCALTVTAAQKAKTPPHTLGMTVIKSPAATESAPLLLKKSEVCERLALSPRTLEGMVKERSFPPPVRVGKHVYWSDKAVTSWMSRMFGAQEAWRPI